MPHLTKQVKKYSFSIFLLHFSKLYQTFLNELCDVSFEKKDLVCHPSPQENFKMSHLTKGVKSPLFFVFLITFFLVVLGKIVFYLGEQIKDLTLRSLFTKLM